MTVDIIVKLVRKRRRYNNTNFLLTRPLMEKYRNRLCMKSVLVCFVQTFYFGILLFLPFLLIDSVIYISASQKFYALT